MAKEKSHMNQFRNKANDKKPSTKGFEVVLEGQSQEKQIARSESK